MAGKQIRPPKRRKPSPPLKSVAIQRLIKEVSDQNPKPWGGYNRTYHRHNR